MDNDMLPCPECHVPAISMRDPEHTELDCPGCGVRIRSNVTGDHTGDWWEAEVVEDDEGDDDALD
jgi:hypothetical protein